MAARLFLSGVLLVAFALPAYGQAIRPPAPYNAQLRTDPDVGNVQGIQRYGRPLKTDPDQGEGYSYHVYPVAHPNTVAVGQVAGQLATGAAQSAPLAEPPALQKAKEKATKDFDAIHAETDPVKRKQLATIYQESYDVYTKEYAK